MGRFATEFVFAGSGCKNVPACCDCFSDSKIFRRNILIYSYISETSDKKI